MYAPTETHERRLRALVLDADDASLRATRRSLERAGFDVLCAADGAAGLALLLDELLHLDVVVSALDLPGRDARSLAHLVRRAGGEHDLALVVPARGVTAALRTELSALGVDAVVDRGEGPRAVAAAALAAVAMRTSPAVHPSAARPAPPPPAPSPLGTWAERFARWSPVAA